MADAPTIDWEDFARAREELGAEFVRILGYFREDGTKSVVAIEEAMRRGDAVALIVPAHTLKGEAQQFGAGALADAAETIETIARHCVECRQSPDELLPTVVQLAPLFSETMAAFDRAINPLVERRAFGHRAAGAPAFGRL